MRKSPQEKKQLSYRKDRRNAFGENDKSSRRNIRRNKRAVSSANRRREHLALVSFPDLFSPTDAADAVEEALHRRRQKTWKKVPDQPLGLAVALRLERRASVGMAEGPQTSAYDAERSGLT